MAEKKRVRPETKSEFLRKVLSRDPDLDHRQINQRWAKSGRAGEISAALFYQVRAKMGIRTEWAWVPEGGAETSDSRKSEPGRGDRPNGDLVEAAESVLPDILMFYKRFQDRRPVMLLDVQSQGI
jgi:hypothetical protein